MPNVTQDNRLLAVDTSLGKDVLLLQSFSGEEHLSRLFQYELVVLSERETIAPADLVGKKIGWTVSHVDKEPRHFHGILRRLTAGARDARGQRTYRLEVVPWFWFLTRTSNCRIFQAKTTPQIIETVFKEVGFSDFQLKLRGTYSAWEYCVQYRETAFNFVSRLMEHEGIFYYFLHEAGKHTLVLADSLAVFQEVPESPVRYNPGTLTANHVATWDHQYEYRSGKWTHTDYNFETPSLGLVTSATTLLALPDLNKFELFDYPGIYGVKGHGESIGKIRMEEAEAPFDVAYGSSSCCTFTPGGKFKLEDHAVGAENGEYALTSVRHEAVDTSYGGSAGGSKYQNQFSCMPAKVVYRPPRATAKPIVHGLQTAVVVGPSGEEIYVDKYGRVKVQFFWDRLGKKDENSSCWVRVAEQWAGKNWGFVAHPRIGQEVVVEFLEGDPDRPLITGRVYNAEQMPPYDLPAEMTQSGIKSRSSKSGSADNYNEIRFEDKKGSELITIHAEKDQSIEVEHDESHWVGHDRSKTIDRDETTHVKRDRTETVDRNESITIGNNRTEEVKKDESITIDNNRTEEVKKDESITIGNNRTEEVKKDESITIGQSRTTSIGKNEQVTISENRQEQVGKNETVSVNENRQVSIGKNDQLNVGKILLIAAGDEITLQTGSASIIMKSNGDIQIKGSNITVSGSGKIDAKASGQMTLKGSKIAAN
jgi:type VI secretion system secreted protein VgrG